MTPRTDYVGWQLVLRAVLDASYLIEPCAALDAAMVTFEPDGLPAHRWFTTH